MAKIRVTHHPSGYYDLRRAPGVVADLERRGAAVHERAGGDKDGYDTTSQQGAKRPQGRWRVSVAAVTVEAKRDNARRNTLLRALDAGRG